MVTLPDRVRAASTRRSAGWLPWWHCVATLIAGGLLLSSCATAFHAPINVQVASATAAIPPAAPPDVGGNTVLALAFSGGGTRAAAFADGVMHGLDRIPAGGGRTYFDRIVFISGVSGGSVAAGYYGLRGRAALAHFRERFLSRNAEQDLDTSVSFVSAARGIAGGVNDASRLPQWLDRNLFDGATLGDLYAPGKPIVWINASDLYNRTPFMFSPVTFAALCSDARAYPLSQAVAASAAVPVAFVPIVLASFPDGCDVPLPPWVERVLADRNAGAQVRAFATALRRYRDPGQLRFVKLSDGGITDNFGLSGIVIAREAAGQPYAPLPRRQAIALRRIVFVVVNAGTGTRGDWSKTVEGPSGVEMLGAVTDTAIDSVVRSGFDSFRLSLRDWEEDLRRWRCRLSQAEAARLGAPADWRCSALNLEIVEIAFDQFDPVRAAQLAGVATRFQLPADQVNLLIDAGTDAVLTHPGLRRALGRAGAS